LRIVSPGDVVEEEVKQPVKEVAIPVTKEKWTDEEIAHLTLGIKKFPPGANERWKSVASFIGTKNAKQVIAKAKEIQARQQLDVEAKRKIEEDKKERQE